MPYPRLLKLDEKTLENLKSYLDWELIQHDADRVPYLDDLKRWQREYWAKASKKEKTVPFVGAANLVVPLNSIAVESIYSRAVLNLLSTEPHLNVEMRVGQFSKAEKPLEDFLEHEIIENGDGRRAYKSGLLELIKYGTVVGRSSYVRIVKNRVQEGPDGKDEEIPVIMKDSSQTETIPGANFIMPMYVQDPQLAPWVGRYVPLSPVDVVNHVNGGLFYKDTWDRLRGWLQYTEEGHRNEREFLRNQQTLEGTKPSFPRYFDFAEMSLSWNVRQDVLSQGDGSDQEIVVWYHRASRTIAALRYNWYEDLRRDFRLAQNIPVEHRWRGIGVAKQVEQFQKEITTIHRQRLDNGTIANMRMFKIKKLAGFDQDEPIFPGKIWWVDNMDDVDSFQVGEIYQSSFANEQAASLYYNQATGVNELTLGLPQAGTPGTATSDIARLKEGSIKFDAMMDNAKVWVSDLALDTFLNVKQFGPRYPDYLNVVEGGQEVIKLLELDWKTLRSKVLFRIRAVAASNNRLQDRQDAQGWAMLLNTYYTTMVEMAVMLGRQDIAQLILTKAMGAATETMRQIGETFEQRNLQRILVSEVEGLLKQGQQGNGQEQPIIELLNPGGTESPTSGIETIDTESGLRLLKTFTESVQDPRRTSALGAQ